MPNIDWKKEFADFRNSRGDVATLEQPAKQSEPQQPNSVAIDWKQEMTDFRQRQAEQYGIPTQTSIQAQQPMSIGETLGKIALAPAEPLKQFIRDPAMLVRTVPETLGGKSPKEKIVEKFGTKLEGERWTPAFLRSLAAQTVGDIGNIATSPASYIIPQATELALMSKPVQVALRKYLPNLTTKLGLNRALNPGEEAYASWLKNPKVSATPTELVGEQTNPIAKITQALKEAKPIRGEQELLYQIERKKRLGAIIEAGQTVPGEQGYFAQLKAAKGELPKVQFENISGKVSQTDIDNLFSIVRNSPSIQGYEQLSAQSGLIKLLGAEGGSVPTEGEIALLSKVFPSDFIKTVLSKRTLTKKLFEGTEEVLNVPRAVMASADLSAPMRQGIFLSARHPILASKSFKEMFKYAFNEKSYDDLIINIQKRPNYQLMKESGLAITDIGKTLSNREERFMSNLAEKIPIGGHIVRGSNRAYTGFLNKLRADVFDNLVASAEKQGIKIEGKTLTDLSNFINTASGRGKLPGMLEKSAVALNSIFFSPRLMASRIQLLNPVYYAKLDPFVRKEALKSLFAFTGTATSIITLAKMGGAEIGTDPRSANFGKIKVGNTRYDILGGFQQYIRLGAQLVTGEHISSTTGVKTTVGEGYKSLTRTDILGRFLETKEAPVVTFALGLLRGQNSLGKEFNIPQEVAQRFIPMVIQDMVDLYKERGIEGVAMGTPAIFGVGLQTYFPTPTEIVYSAKSVIKNFSELKSQGRINEAAKLAIRNKKLIEQAQKLEPLQTELSKYEKAKKQIIQDVRFSPEQKKKGLTYVDMMIKKFGKKMEEKYKEIK